MFQHIIPMLSYHLQATMNNGIDLNIQKIIFLYRTLIVQI